MGHNMQWLYFICVLWSVLHTGVPVCSLATGKNAVYEWIPEDTPQNTIVTKLPIQGRSAADNAEIQLRLVAGNEWFELDERTKELTLKRGVDRDTGTLKLEGVVECISILPNDNFKVNISVHVNIKDVNDNAPVFKQHIYYVNITEELPPGTVILDGLSATDNDQRGPNSEIKYSIPLDAPYSELLTISNPWEGKVVVKGRIDFESLNNFTVPVVAQDSGYPPQQSAAQIQVNVIDVDDQNPIFDYESYSAIVNEQNLGQTLRILPRPIHAVDQDTLRVPVAYRLSGKDANKFDLDANSGKIRVIGSLQSGDTYLLTLHAHQVDRLEKEGHSELRVQVSGPSAHGPLFSQSKYTARVPESAQVGTKILSVSANDKDQDSSIIYTLHSDRQPALFKIGRETGDVRLARPVDFESESSHRLIVQATDGTQTAQAEIQIEVIDENDHAPEFSQPMYSFSPDGTSNLIGSVRASDKDSHDRLTYLLLNFNEIFAIDPEGGVHVINGGLLHNVTYEMVVMVKDDATPPKMGHAIVRVDFSASAAMATGQLPKSPSVLRVAGNRGALILIIALASLSLVLFIACFFLLIYIIRIRRKKLDKAWQMKREKLIVANPTGCSPFDVVNHYGTASAINGAVTRSTTMQRRYGNQLDNNAFVSEESPHGSHSPLQQNSSGGSSIGAGPQHPENAYQRQENAYAPNSTHDRAMSFAYTAGSAFIPVPSDLRQSGLLLTDNLVTTNNSAGQMANGDHQHQDPEIMQRPPLTVYF